MSKPTILIVDDEPFNVDYLEQELEELDYQTISAVNGQEGLDRARSGSPDLILLDIMMPVMDGFEMLAHLKADSCTRDIPVIVISANNDMQSVVRGIRLGAEDYLPKPFEPTLLYARISSSLEKKHLRDLQQLYLKSLERELEIGHNIQQGFLPSHLPELNGWDIAAYFKAAHEVAGDFYDAFRLPDGNLICVVGDVCDKGVGAALFMTLFRSLIRATSLTDLFCSGTDIKTLTPAERVRHVISFTNNYIAETHLEANMFATVFASILNVRDGKLTYVNCGNEPPILFGSGETVTVLRPTGPVVGLFPDTDFRPREISMEKGDLLLAFTDGIPDARNPQDDSFGNERLLECLKGGLTTAAGLSRTIEEQLHEFMGPAQQFDDITLLVVGRGA
ncbi:MAG TPA: SpoIIE family protein phosphatase [Anaerolineales bacterium]|nr:SpoIIE family protein phosphatase [Anaerolineales bacterium]